MSLVDIQVNHTCRNTPDITKKLLKKTANEQLNVEYWKTLKVDVQALATIIADGYTVQPGIKVGRADEEGVTGIQWLFIDFDDTPVSKTLAGAWSSQACMWYYTPSYQPGVNEKHRLVFKLAKVISAEEYQHIAKVIINLYYKDADPRYHSGSIYFGAYDANSVTILDENATLDPDIFLQVSLDGIDIKTYDGQDKQPDNQAALPAEAGEGITAQVLKWINKEIWLKLCDSYEVDTLYALHPHNFEEQPKDKKNFHKWGGHRPEDKEKDYGSGFFVYWADADYPPRFTNQVGGISGTIIKYWHHYGNLLHAKNWGSIEWNDDRNYETFQLVCDDIARWFKIDCFDFDRARAEIAERRAAKKKEKTDSLTMQVETILSSYVKIIKKGARDGYIYYDFLTGVWRVKPSEINVYRDCVKYALKNHYGVEAGELSSPKIAAYVCSLIKYYDGYDSVEDKRDFDEMRNTDIIPMANGDFNYKTKEFVANFNPSNYNTMRSKISYRAVTEESLGVKYLNYWLTEIKYSDIQRQAITSWIIVNCLGIATKTKRMLCVYGTPNTGKTVVGQIIQNCLGTLGYTARGNTLTDTGNRFANQSLDNLFSLFIDEFRTDLKGWELLKQLTGNANITIEIEQKGLPSYNAKFYAGITTATQDHFYIPNSDDGGIRRRVVLLKHTKEMYNPDLVDVDEEFGKPEIYQDIFNWAIMQDAERAVQDFITYAKSDEARTVLQESLVQNDKVLMFINECLQFTDNPDNTVTNHELQTAYQTWLETEIGESTQNETIKGKIAKIPQFLREKAEIPDNNISWSLMPEKGKDSKVKVDGKFVRGFKGIIIKLPCDEVAEEADF